MIKGAWLCLGLRDTCAFERFLEGRSERRGAVGSRQVGVDLAALHGAPQAVP